MDGFLFLDDDIESKGNFYARITPNIYSLEQLFDALYYSCWFPTYFGSNWDALGEVMRDFSWIKEEVIIIRHECIPKLSDDELKIYFSILDFVRKEMKGDKDIRYIFSKKDKAIVEYYLANS